MPDTMPDTAVSQKTDDPNQARTDMPITVHGQYIKDLSFEIPKAPNHLHHTQKPQIKVNFDIGAKNLEKETYEVYIKCNVKSSTEDMVIYLIDLVYAGVLSVKALPAHHQRSGAVIEGARLMFPFVRSLLMLLTREGGFSPLMINPIDFNELYRRWSKSKETSKAIEAETVSIPVTESKTDSNKKTNKSSNNGGTS